MLTRRYFLLQKLEQPKMLYVGPFCHNMTTKKSSNKVHTFIKSHHVKQFKNIIITPKVITFKENKSIS